MKEPELTIAFRVTPEGRLESRTFTSPSHGEDNVDEAVNLAVILLRETGEVWGPVGRPIDTGSEIDAMARGPQGFLYLQVVRIPVDGPFWKALATKGVGRIEATVQELAGHLIDGIRLKARRYSREAKSKLLLILDGSRGSLYDSPAVLEEFARLYLSEAWTAGFDDIFLLGHSRFVNLIRLR